jgi:hypothetical protein
MYRRALLAEMRAHAGLKSSAFRSESNSAATVANTVSLRNITVHEALTAGRDSALSAETSARLRRAVLAYALAGFAQAFVGACMWLLLSKTTFIPFRLTTLTWIYAWPVILTWNVLSGPDWKSRIRRFVSYFAGLALLSAIALTEGDLPYRIGQGALLWTTLELTPTVMLYSALARPIRAIGPVVLVFMSMAVFGSQVAVGLYESVFSGGVPLPFSDPRFWVVSLAGFIVFGCCSQSALWFFRRRYERKRTSDIVLTIDCIWLLFALFACEIQSDAHGFWRISPLLMFMAYKTVISVCFRSLYRQAVISPGRRLLILRVFGFRARTRRLMDLLGARWRHVGSVQLIAGADVAADYLGIPQFLDFLWGRLKSYFILSMDDLGRRMRELDLKPDADGRFRVSMFFCFDDTWKMTADRLIRESDAILMDLRGFTRANRGCAEELRIISSAPASCILLLIDSRTDLQQLNNELAGAMINESTSRIRILRAARSGPTVSAAIALLDPGTKVARAT